MTKRHVPKQPDLILGPLPVELIWRTVGIELETGSVALTRGAQAHAAKRHPTEYPVLLPHVASVIADPLYIGDDAKNPGKIELISRVTAAQSFVLVAVNLERDARGQYHVASFYPVSEVKVQTRRFKGFLKITRKS